MNRVFVKYLRHMSFVFLTVFFIGCAYEKEAYPYQPLVKPPKTVEGIFKPEPHTPETLASELVGKSGQPSHLWWRVDFMTHYKADKVVDTCLDYLADIEQSSQPISIPMEKWPDDRRYPWLWFENALGPTTADYTESGDLKIRKRAQMGFNVINTIVCLKPIVVVQTKGLIIDHHSSGGPRITRYSPQANEIFDKFGTYSLSVLKHGYAYGTHIPYAENPLWFSPNMNISPRPIKIDENGVGHIPLSWGELILEKQADEWIAIAQAR